MDRLKKMKTVCIIPIKSNSKRVKRKNFIKINGKPLYTILLSKIKKCKFDEIFVDTDSAEIKKYCKTNKINIIERIPKLLKDSANGNHLLIHHSKIIKADIYFQAFVTSPLLKVKTINSCIDILKKNKKKYDSILTSRSMQTWFWFNKKPVNYNPRILPRSQDAKPVLYETTGLYGITEKSLRKNNCRIGNKPFFFEVSNKEAIDLDNKKDFQYLKFILKKK